MLTFVLILVIVCIITLITLNIQSILFKNVKNNNKLLDNEEIVKFEKKYRLGYMPPKRIDINQWYDKFNPYENI